MIEGIIISTRSGYVWQVGPFATYTEADEARHRAASIPLESQANPIPPDPPEDAE